MRTTVPYHFSARRRPARCVFPVTRDALNVARGWTLVELLVSCAIVATLAGLAVPGLQHWLNRAAQTAMFDLLQHAASFARSQAIIEHRYFTVCGSDNGIHCSGQWRDHIMIFSDDNRNEAIDKGERLYRTFSVADHMPCIQWRASAGRHYLQFRPNGAVNGTAGHFRLCQGTPGQAQHKLVVSLNGRTSLRSL